MMTSVFGDPRAANEGAYGLRLSSRALCSDLLARHSSSKQWLPTAAFPRMRRGAASACGLPRSTWQGGNETEILAIFIRQGFRNRQQRVRIDEAHTPSDLFWTTNLQPLSRFDSMHKLRSVKQALERSSIQPGYSAR